MASFVRIVQNLSKVCDQPHEYPWARSPLKMIFDAIAMTTSAEGGTKEWMKTGCGDATLALWAKYRNLLGGDNEYSSRLAKMSDTEVVATMRQVVEYYK